MTTELGTVDIADGKAVSLELRVTSKPHQHVMNVRTISLSPRQK